MAVDVLRWTDGAMMLLDDAAHPMTQYMAQGAATAMDDAIVLSRCIADTPSVQGASSQNTFMRKPIGPSGSMATMPGQRWETNPPGMR